MWGSSERLRKKIRLLEEQLALCQEQVKLLKELCEARQTIVENLIELRSPARPPCLN